jgi:hypothetical protein
MRQFKYTKIQFIFHVLGHRVLELNWYKICRHISPVIILQLIYRIEF